MSVYLSEPLSDLARRTGYLRYSYTIHLQDTSRLACHNQTIDSLLTDFSTLNRRCI